MREGTTAEAALARALGEWLRAREVRRGEAFPGQGSRRALERAEAEADDDLPF